MTEFHWVCTTRAREGEDHCCGCVPHENCSRLAVALAEGPCSGKGPDYGPGIKGVNKFINDHLPVLLSKK